MQLRRPRRDTAIVDDALRQIIRNTIREEFEYLLSDVDWRIEQARTLADSVGSAPGTGSRKVFAEDLNLKDVVVLTGYAVTANSPSAGSIAWSNLHIVYNGVDTTITDGNTANTYVYWQGSQTTPPATLTTSNTKPTLVQGDVLLFVNNGGTPTVMTSDTNKSMPMLVANNAIDSSSIASGAVTAAKTSINAINNSTGNLASNSVTAGTIASGAISASSAFAAGVINQAAIANGAVGAAQTNISAINSSTGNLAANSVTAGTVASGAINNSNAFTSGVVGSTALASGAVTAAKTNLTAIDSSSGGLASGSVTAGTVASGAITASKMNILQHLLY